MRNLGFLKRGGMTVFFLVVFLIFVPLLQSSVETGIDVLNSAPRLVESIPNQSWAGGSLNNAFDLDDYFTDDNGDNLSYSHSVVDNITVNIDSSNMVSFSSDTGFSGIRNIAFYAFDGVYNTSSNEVYLNVGVDTEPPQWSSPSKDKTTVYQSNYVSFTTIWTDNFGLSSYVFSIDQSGGWIDYAGNFSGVSNVSSYRMQISASGGSLVHWKFCAYDADNNVNCTDIQNFSVVSLPVPSTPSPPSTAPSSPSGGVSAGGISGYLSGIFKSKKALNFTTDLDSFKVSLKQGSTETRILKITNMGSTDLSFDLSVFDVEDFVVLSESNFSIPAGETKEITIDFSAAVDAMPGQYFGKLILEAKGSYTKEIPIVLDIEALDLDFDVDVEILKEYKRVKPGNNIKASILIQNLKDVAAIDLNFYVAVKDFYGNIYDSAEEVLRFGSSETLERELTVPSGVKEGEYIFYARASNDKNIAIDSDVFEVGSRFKFAAFIKSSFIFILIAFLSVFAAVLVLRYRKEKEKERVLSLYLMLNELKNLIKAKEFDKATELYIRIKKSYGEPVSKDILENKEKLKEGIKELSGKLSAEVKEAKEGVKEKVSGIQEKTKQKVQKQAIGGNVEGKSGAKEVKADVKETKQEAEKV